MLAQTPGALGQQVELACRSVGVPRPAVKWYKNADDLTGELDNPTLPDSPKYVFDADSGSLVVTAVDKDSPGIYQCEASNQAGYDLATTWLRTQGNVKIFISMHCCLFSVNIRVLPLYNHPQNGF